jgi:large subunit ribosomal protein L15
MNTLSSLSKTTTKQQKRVGRGYGSGVGGHTTGRGAKGDKIRGKTKITFDGTKIKKGWIKRTPFLRGKHRVLSGPNLYIYNFVNLDKMFATNDLVDIKSLAKKTGIHEKLLINHTKILAKGKLSKALNFKGLILSAKAKSEITSLGGKID